MADVEELSSNNMNVSKLKVSDLRRELKARGLNTNGNKVELAQRLTEAMQSGKNDDGSADSVDELIDEDDVLNDEEIEEEEVDNIKGIDIEDGTKTYDIKTASTKILKRKNSEISNSSTGNGKPTKKIVLNRELSTETDTKSSATTSTATNGSTQEKKLVKLSELSVKERLAMRAKKFGVALSADAKKDLRAQRFGEESKITVSGHTKITLNSTPTANLDVLKKRAERFGTVSSRLIKVETEEKLEQRKARFGVVAANGATNEQQKAKRLERFKITLK